MIPEKLKKGENTFSIEWLNKGVAPAYRNFILILRFEPEKSGSPFDLFIENSGNISWLPGKKQNEKYVFNIPPGTPKGRYKLGFKLVDMVNKEPRVIQTGVNEKLIDNHGFVCLGVVSL
jgi:hypothetical protein